MKTITATFYWEVPKNFTGIVEYLYERKEWFKEGKYHREDGPAVEWVNGYKEWWIEGKRHRTDGPASEYANGTKEWYKEGKLHREDGPAIIWTDGSKSWWVDSVCLEPFNLQYLIQTSVFLGKQKGKHNLDWLRFLTDEGIVEFPVIPGMEEYKEFKLLFDQVFEAPIK